MAHSPTISRTALEQPNQRETTTNWNMQELAPRAIWDQSLKSSALLVPARSWSPNTPTNSNPMSGAWASRKMVLMRSFSFRATPRLKSVIHWLTGAEFSDSRASGVALPATGVLARSATYSRRNVDAEYCATQCTTGAFLSPRNTSSGDGSAPGVRLYIPVGLKKFTASG